MAESSLHMNESTFMNLCRAGKERGSSYLLRNLGPYKEDKDLCVSTNHNIVECDGSSFKSAPDARVHTNIPTSRDHASETQ